MPEKCGEPCAELQRLEHQFEEYQAQNGSSHQGIYDRLRTLETSDAVQDAKYDAIMQKLDALTAKVDALEAKPARRWDKLTETTLVLIVTAVVAFLLGRVGL